MEPKQTKLYFLYNLLRKQILSGLLEYGSRLPSARRIAQTYQTSIRTSKAALKLLCEEGLIQTEPRRRAVVIYKAPFTSGEHSAVLAVLAKRKSIMAAYETMEALMPDIFTYCFRVTPVSALKHYETALKQARRANPAGSWSAASDLLRDSLHASGNLLFRSVFSALEQHAEVSFLLDYQQPLTTYSPYTETASLRTMIHIMQHADSAQLRERFTQNFHATTVSMQKSLDKLQEKYPGAEEEDTVGFSWKPTGGQFPYYIKIIRLLLEQIGAGRYPPGTLLPSEASLARQYGVSVHTIRKALAVLNASGFSRTINGRGTVVCRSDRSIYLKNGDRRLIMLYLSALQLMAFASRPAARLAFDAIREQDIPRLRAAAPLPYSALFSALQECLLNRTPLYPLAVILKETRKIISWGFYDPVIRESLNEICRRACICLQNGERQGFVNGVFDCYRSAFFGVRRFLAEEGMIGPDEMPVPD